MTIHRVKKGPDAAERLRSKLRSARRYDTIELDGWIKLSTNLHWDKPVHLVRAGREGGLQLDGAAEVVVGPPRIDLAKQGIPWQGARAGAMAITFGIDRALLSLPKGFNLGDLVGEHIFIWSLDSLSGVIQHQGPAQFPGECHRIIEIELFKEDGTAVAWLASSLRDGMRTEPKFAVMFGRPWRCLEFDVDLVGSGHRTATRALEASGVPGFRLRTTLEDAGELAIQCPDCDIDATILSQANPEEVNGINMGPWCSNYRVVGRGSGCRHVHTTSGIPVAYAGGEVLCGSPWGTCSMRVSGRYNAPLDTHASGHGIVFDRCHVEIQPTREHMGGAGIKIRSRDTLVRDCVVVGAAPNDAGITAVDVWASGTRIQGLQAPNCWLRTNVSGPGSIVSDA